MSKRKLTIGEKLRRLREYSGKRSQEVAADLYFTGATVSRAEHDVGEITVNKLKIFCDYYGVSLKDFFDNDYWEKYEAERLKKMIKNG